jgi:CBS domain-containing protein
MSAENLPHADTPVERTLMHEKIGSLPRNAPVSATPSTTVAEAVALLADNGIGALPVMDEDVGVEILGIFSERDVLLKIGTDFDALKHNPIGDYMTSDPTCLAADATIGFAMHTMLFGDYRHVPICEGDKLLGVVSGRSVLLHLLNNVQ